MADTISPEMRRRNMSAIRSKNTKPEVFLRKKLFARGIRYRLHLTTVEGHPDMYLRKFNVAIFVHGCFWHRHQGCRFSYNPKSNCEFWNTKFEKNVKRDRQVLQSLLSQGIRCVVIWECRIKKMMKDPTEEEKIISMIQSFLDSSDYFLEL